MACVKIPLPDKYIYSTEIPIRIDDINQGNHISHISFIIIMQEARTRFFQSFFGKCRPDELGYILADLSIMYLRQGHYGQTLRVEIAITELTDKGFELIYKITDTKTGLELARAKTRSLGFNYGQQKVATIPSEIKEKFRQAEWISN